MSTGSSAAAPGAGLPRTAAPAARAPGATNGAQMLFDGGKIFERTLKEAAIGETRDRRGSVARFVVDDRR